LGPLGLVLALQAVLTTQPSGRRLEGANFAGLFLALLATVLSHGVIFSLFSAARLP
jgi:hypothetical protein